MQTALLNKMNKNVKELIHKSLPQAISYTEYRNLVSTLAQEGKSTGPVQTEALANYTQLNDRRMKRWDKTFRIDEETIAKIQNIEENVTWLVLTESWCGDASPALPVMQKISEINPNITFKIVLRDENLELMNQFLTNNAMSIPKLIQLDSETSKVLGTWGPRSKNATELVMAYKSKHGVLSAEFKQDLQVWYNKDKGQSVLNELMELLPLK